MWLVNMSSTVARSRIFAAVERAAAQQHALELQVLARRRVQPVAAGPPLRLLGPVERRVASHAPSSPRRCTGTEFARCSSLIRNVVWVIPSGPRMCSAK